MKRMLPLLAAALLSGGVNADNHSTTPLTTQDILNILAHPERSDADKARDAARQPANVLTFSDVQRGYTVLDMNAGDGWYTELLSLAVGDSGKVYMHNDEIYFPFAQKDLQTRTQDNRLSNVERLDNVAVEAIALTDKSVDLAFASLSYHDLFFTDYERDGETVVLRSEAVDYQAALSTIHRILKDDGVFVVIDHIGQAGSGDEASNTLHRIDPKRVKYQFSQSGFRLVEQAYYLANADDDYTKSVFDPALRGKTDRFIFKFAKK
ncbi:class I SAM-dependent methyltransferase [Aestuariibacter salexigens]|uniref:class I SAM-dependent methyltransferase n=1 Tax=Aestuariibacter salexigens TaxID=226010 RepID=UPI00047DB102|nr:methyltransferase domain-containing protein [Aestuariibacter salexigens]